MRAFVEADINLLARDVRLDLLLLRGFTRAKYGMRSEAVALLLGIDSLAQLLIQMHNWVRTRKETQAYTLSNPPTHPAPGIPRLSSHYTPEYCKVRVSTSDHLFRQVRDIQPTLAGGFVNPNRPNVPSPFERLGSTILPSPQRNSSPKDSAPMAPPHEYHRAVSPQPPPTGERDGSTQRPIQTFMSITPRQSQQKPVPSGPATQPDGHDETDPHQRETERSHPPEIESVKEAQLNPPQEEGAPRIPDIRCEPPPLENLRAAPTKAHYHQADLPLAPKVTAETYDKTRSKKDAQPELPEEVLKQRKDQIARVLNALKAIPKWEHLKRDFPFRSSKGEREGPTPRKSGSADAKESHAGPGMNETLPKPKAQPDREAPTPSNRDHPLTPAEETSLAEMPSTAQRRPITEPQSSREITPDTPPQMEPPNTTPEPQSKIRKAPPVTRPAAHQPRTEAPTEPFANTSPNEDTGHCNW